MATRQNTFLLKRSNVIGKIPPLSGLTVGELGLNTADAILYTLFTSGTTGGTEVREIGWNRIHRTGDTMNGDLIINGNLTVTGNTITNLLSGNTLTLTATPVLNNNLTQILGRNETTGDVEYRNLNTIGNNYTYVSGATYSALTTDNVLGVDSSISATTIYLPDSVSSGRLRYDIKDIGLNCFNNNITIVSAGSDTIISTENSNTVILEADGGALIIFNTGTGTWLQM